MPKLSSISLFKNIKALIGISQNEIVQTVNIKMVETYYQIGGLIIEFEQLGQIRAKYAASTLKDLSVKLIKQVK